MGDAGEILFAAGAGDAGDAGDAGGAGAGAGASTDGVGAHRRDPLSEAVALMARIRRDGKWEAAQTHASLLPYLLEESWELVDAVADGDRDELVSELGDLLLQVLFHSAIGAERPGDAFDVQDVAQALLDKLRRRAPYWFTDSGSGDLDAAEQDRLWQEAKAAERRDAELAGRARRGVLDGISWDQPSLALGQKVLGRARSAGIPDDLVPDEMRLVRVDPVGVFHESGSAEVSYRQIVRAFADRIRTAESRLNSRAADAASGAPADTARADATDATTAAVTAAAWRAAWPS
ncbi:MazG family protein [Dietzia alimentaria]|uniref:MazG family protein n=1 Tax=Dietzia alimentaria TaxID=665550 RepID=UPI00029A5502|nr:MazG family protein [Dietzia alimentaria]